MSATIAPKVRLPESAPAPTRRLRQVTLPRTPMARVPFAIVVATILALGMVGLLVLNTALQTQAIDLRQAQIQASNLDHVVNALNSKVNQLRSPAQVAQRASALGMRPNPYTAFVLLPDGKIVGNPKKVTGEELPSMVYATDAQMQEVAKADVAAAVAQPDAQATGGH